MSKFVFFHYLKFTREFLIKIDELGPIEWDRYQSLAKKNGLKILAHDDPWVTEYHRISVLESVGVEAWTAFIREYIAYGTPDAWKYVEVSRTNITTPME